MRFCPHCAAPLIPRRTDSAQRLACKAECGYVFWDNPVPVLAAVIEHEGLVLLARNKNWPDGMFGLVTGFLERDETPEQGVLREVEEEIGIAGELVAPIGNYAFSSQNQIILAYHVRTAGSIHLGDELADYRLIEPVRVRPWDFGTGPALRDWLARRLGE